MPCLTLIGTASIQDYLFRTNRLKENLGASWLAAEAIRDFAPRSEREQIFEGGGNAAVLFPDRCAAECAIYDWSRHWLDKAPGLRLVAAHVPYEEGALAQAYPDAVRGLFTNENRPPFGAPLGALPVVRTCSSTGLAADTPYGDSWLNEESARKQFIADTANEAFQHRYQVSLSVGNNKLRFALDFEDLGQREGASHIAVVHVDGNGVGEVFQYISQAAHFSDAAFIQRMRDASNAIRRVTRDALAATLKELSAALPALEKQGIYLKTGYYPIRPLVDEGDELTAVCQGKVGLLFAKLYVRNAELEAAKHVVALGRSLTFSAGVAIVGQRFPFARAYRLAEELTGSAKRRRKLVGDNSSWIDFEVLREGADASLDKLRTQYLRMVTEEHDRTSQWQLLRRPYQLGDGGEWSWEACERRWRTFNDPEKWPRSLAKRLLETLARRPGETETLVRELASRGRLLPEAAPGTGTWFDGGAVIGGNNTLYFDPLDILDFHVDWSAATNPDHKEDADVAIAD